MLAGRDRDAQHARIELLEHPAFLRRLVAGMQRRELDRDAVAFLRPLPAGRLAHRGDRVEIGRLVALGVGVGARALAQHVERADEARPRRALQRRLDGAAEHELIAHHPDRGGDRAADHRLADPAGQALEEPGQVAPRALVRLDQPPGQHQAPGPGVDEQAVGAADVRRPVGRADLLGDQRVAGGFVGRAQQRLGQAHQRQALRRRQPELLQEALDHPLPPRQPPRLLHQGDRLRPHHAGVGAQRLALQQPRDRGGLVLILARVQRIPVEGRGDGGGGGGHGRTARRGAVWLQAHRRVAGDRGLGPGLRKRLAFKRSAAGSELGFPGRERRRAPSPPSGSPSPYG